MERSILHMDLDTFFVSVERLMDSRLNGKPILVGGTGDRGVVSAASYEARYFGAHSGMAMRLARQLCPEAIVIRGDGGSYAKYSSLITDILKESVPVLEKASIDEFYADLSGMDKFFGCYQYATELRQKVIKESGLPISFGLSVNKTVSKVATNEAKPNNQLRIDFGCEKNFLAPLSVKKIPQVGDKMFQLLSNMGVKKVKTLQEMPVEMLEAAFGKTGILIWEKANGIDQRPVQPFHERKSISNERTFGQDTMDIEKMLGIVKAMAENLAFQLRQGEKLTSCITVKIRYSDFQTLSKQKKISFTAADHILVPAVVELFQKLYDRRLLVRLVGVRFSELTEGYYQISLFDDWDKTVGLYKAMDSVRNRFGSHLLSSAGTQHVKTIASNHNPFNGEPNFIPAHRNQ
ncbi:MAG: DNA polymerase IV [Chitinophagaceae bacterium]|nr:DNA polymerase IV [Chitinophagaceae bacterium]